MYNNCDSHSQCIMSCSSNAAFHSHNHWYYRLGWSIVDTIYLDKSVPTHQVMANEDFPLYLNHPNYWLLKSMALVVVTPEVILQWIHLFKCCWPVMCQAVLVWESIENWLGAAWKLAGNLLEIDCELSWEGMCFDVHCVSSTRASASHWCLKMCLLFYTWVGDMFWGSWYLFMWFAFGGQRKLQWAHHHLCLWYYIPKQFSYH